MVLFNESEAMTVKRIEVALRNTDMNLLKEASYKLYERFHAGYDFEFIDAFEQILDYIKTAEIPQEILDVLRPTIEEILEKSKTFDLPQNQGPVSLNTEDGMLQQEVTQNFYEQNSSSDYASFEPVQSALNFEVSKTQEELYEEEFQNLVAEEEKMLSLQNEITKDDVEEKTNEPTQEYLNEPVCEQPITQVQEYKEPSVELYDTYNNFEQNENPNLDSLVSKMAGNIEIEQSVDEVSDTKTPEQESHEPSIESVELNDETKEDVESIEKAGNIERAPLNILFYYDDRNYKIDHEKIKEYRNLTKSGTSPLDLLSNLIDSADTDISDIMKLLSLLYNSSNSISFVTSSYTSKVLKLLKENELYCKTPSVYSKFQDEAKYDYIPMLGAVNLFKCSNCTSHFMNFDESSPLSLKCPQCGGVALPDIYSTNSGDLEVNPTFWQNAFAHFANSDVWVLVNPPTNNNKVIFDFIQTAFMATPPSKIYLLSVENDKRDIYKKMFNAINPEIEIVAFMSNDTLCEALYNISNMCEVAV